MVKLKQLKQQREKLDKQIKELEEKEEWIEVKDLGIKINKKQQFNGLTYLDILKEVKEEEIATYEILQGLRNRFVDGEKQFNFLQDCWVFVPNPDKIGKKNNYVAWFVAYSNWAYLNCDLSPVFTNAGLGVFLIKKLVKK